MMNGFIHWPKPYLLLPTTCGEILSWMTEIWMENHSVSYSNCNTPKLKSLQNLKGVTNNGGSTFSVGDTLLQFINVIEQDKN